MYLTIDSNNTQYSFENTREKFKKYKQMNTNFKLQNILI